MPDIALQKNILIIKIWKRVAKLC